LYASKTLAEGTSGWTDRGPRREGAGAEDDQERRGVASAIYNFARAPQRRWASSNPCEGVELPAVPETTEVRFLTLEEVDALIAHLPQGMFLEVTVRCSSRWR
jgi:hypothetical protein